MNTMKIRDARFASNQAVNRHSAYRGRGVALSVLVAVASASIALPATAQTEDGRFLLTSTVKIQPATRVENITSPPGDLPDQEFQHVNFSRPLTTSLVTVNDLSPDGFRAYVISLRLEGGGFVHFSAKEGLPDVTLPLTQPLKVTGVSVRCDSFSQTRCRYQISLAGN